MPINLVLLEIICAISFAWLHDKPLYSMAVFNNNQRSYGAKSVHKAANIKKNQINWTEGIYSFVHGT